MKHRTVLSMGGRRQVHTCAVRRRRAVVGAAVGLLLAAGCASSEYRYIGGTQASEGAFFKLPRSWQTFEIEREAVTGRPLPISTGGPEPWIVAFDADPQPSLDHLDDAVPAHPVGSAQVLVLGPNERETVSLRALRSLATPEGVDPITAVRQGDPTFEVVRWEDVTGRGFQGERVVFNRRVADGTWVTTDHTALLDRAGNTLFVFQLSCESSCFQANRSRINQIVESWQVRR